MFDYTNYLVYQRGEMFEYISFFTSNLTHVRHFCRRLGEV